MCQARSNTSHEVSRHRPATAPRVGQATGAPAGLKDHFSLVSLLPKRRDRSGVVPRQNYDLQRNQSDRSVAGFACFSVSNRLRPVAGEMSALVGVTFST